MSSILSDLTVSLRSQASSSGFSTPDTAKISPQTEVQSKADGGSVAFRFPTVLWILHLFVSLGIVLGVDKLLERAFTAVGIEFPSALFGLFCVFSVLMVLDCAAPSAAMGLVMFFEPATMFIQRWLPLFYVPSLVVLPLAVKDIPADSGIKICLIIVGGWLASLVVAGYTAITVRRIVKTEMIDAEPMAKPSPFTNIELWTWTSVFVLTFILAFVNPKALGTCARTCLPFLLAATVLGYMVGTGLPAGVKKLVKRHAAEIFSSVIITAIFSLYSTAIVGRIVGLEPTLTISILPRCITVALALRIVSLFEGANASLTAAVVVVNGLIGANFAQTLMDKLCLHDPIARGIATASSAHGLGTAALSAKEPEALPFCAIAYSLTGIFGSLICSVPAVRESFLLIAG